MQILFIVVVFGEFGGRGGMGSNALFGSPLLSYLPPLSCVLTKGLVNRIVSLNDCPDPDVSICSGSRLKELSLKDNLCTAAGYSGDK